MLFDFDRFSARHIGPSATERDAMVKAAGAESLDALVGEAIPKSIRLNQPLALPQAQSEYEFLQNLRSISGRNQIFKSYIGLGYSDTITPSVILRNVLENPGWYTPYTPYQAELAQGRLEALLNFQTVVEDLTGMEVANASLLDEATAAAEAMALLHRVHTGDARKFFVADSCFPQTIDVLRARAQPQNIELTIGGLDTQLGAEFFGAVVQSPDEAGAVHDLTNFIAGAKRSGARVAVGTDLLSLVLLTPPGEIGADVVFGNSQRFGVPLGYGGPHAAFFATRKEFVRQMPGRIIGVSVARTGPARPPEQSGNSPDASAPGSVVQASSSKDAHGDTAYRMALQTREQHIRRDRATSNICTAQALLANIAGLYAVYHGPKGLTAIARRVHGLAKLLERELAKAGVAQRNANFFDTLQCDPPAGTIERIRQSALAARMNFRYREDGTVNIALDETASLSDLQAIVRVFAAATGAAVSFDSSPENLALDFPASLARTSHFLTHPVFNAYHSETQMMRYIRGLERKDIGLDTSMIPLGSCTMKLNAASEMLPITWPEFSTLHPFVPLEQAAGYQTVFRELEQMLCEITGLAAVSLQPNAGSQGEFTGLMVIRAYHHSRGDTNRNVVLIPESAHGTNPASATMAGMRLVLVASTPEGNIDLADLRRKAEIHRDALAALMVTYPSTHGVFEDSIQEICAAVHENGGQVYMDGANMNAQIGLTNPALIGADVCHLNLHKTFAIPHGGGGPGMGPIAVASHLAQFLPGHPLIKTGGSRAIPAVAAAPWSSASILLISYGYLKMLGRDGLIDATRFAILNANYIKARLEKHYPVLYTRANGRVAHELIFDLRPLKAQSGIDEIDVAKRLIDYGFHAPTVSFPVPGTLMVEPTESESKDELDRFCDAMMAIRGEIQAVIDGKADRADNLLKNAPHTAAEVCGDDWAHPYSRQQAAYPLPFVRARKFWPSVGRIDNAFGDRNLMCSCPPVEALVER